MPFLAFQVPFRAFQEDLSFLSQVCGGVAQTDVRFSRRQPDRRGLITSALPGVAPDTSEPYRVITWPVSWGGGLTPSETLDQSPAPLFPNLQPERLHATRGATPNPRTITYRACQGTEPTATGSTEPTATGMHRLNLRPANQT